MLDLSEGPCKLIPQLTQKIIGLKFLVSPSERQLGSKKHIIGGSEN